MSSQTSPNVPGQPGTRKVAIPRLQRPSQTAAVSRDRRRVPRACTACRSHKIRCSGDTPRCKHCEVSDRECIYILPRRDRLKIVTDRCVQMAGMLKEVKNRAGDEDGRIGDLLDAIEEDISELRNTSAPSNPDVDTDDAKAPMGPASGESLDALDAESHDLLEEDLTRDEQARATGFVGKASEVQWFRSIKLQLERTDDDLIRPATSPLSPSMRSKRRSSYSHGSTEQVSSFNFYLDSNSIDPDFFVDASELPPPDTAEHLLSCYMATVHNSFPILPRKAFENQFREYFSAVRTGSASRLGLKWQAILNLVFAIGAKYSHLVKSSWQTDERDHLIYQSRARAYGLSGVTLSSHPDVPKIQVLGLLSFYYLSVGQISRAWMMIGLALRFAYALGLHVRNEDPSASPMKKETLVRIWWSLFSLERLLSAITGRPSIIVDSNCSVPLPLAHPEDQHMDDIEAIDRPRNLQQTTPSPTIPNTPTSTSLDESKTPLGFGVMLANTGSYFKALVQMGIITQDVISTLYSAGTMIRTPEEIQQSTIELGQRIDEWILSLPPEFNFQTKWPDSDSQSQNFNRERMLLGWHFFSARILLTRPSLGGLGHGMKDPNVPDSFTRRMASTCIDAARATVDLLPDQPNPLFLYENGPWWCIVHNIMQALSVFLLGLSYSTPASSDNPGLLSYAKKLVRWLRVMQDPLAERASQMASSMLEAVAARLSLDLSDPWAGENMYPNLRNQATFGAAVPATLRSNMQIPFIGPVNMSGAGSSSIFALFDCSSEGRNGPIFENPFFGRPN
ncbi:C6 transcription factor-like protein [Lindgomyces ingoldianus]|uniref:C6 transcription factor-like protein n=1 Tax=Lindgomyces ingoldianus TaxID=673940 RepID=A0ACB6Q7P9_9PLEO|nr:C6 transcription factor-like protein [Lindgomyces ingoldianus]KAF2462958.1 C6 transcription factor-like protein [Lindgomyces ingoldianus]